MADQYAIQDQNRFPAMTGHSGTSNDAEVRRVIVNAYGQFSVNVSDVSGQASVTVGPFGEMLTGTKQDHVTLNFKYPYYNTTFDMKPEDVSGDGTISVSNSLLSVSSPTLGTAIAESRNNLMYKSGHTAYADFTSSFDGTGTGYAGAFDDDDGFFVKVSNGTASIGRMYGGVQTGLISQDSWNGDADLTKIDWSNLNLFRIIFGYLGVANIAFQIRKNGWKTLHVIETEGEIKTTTVKNPTFPLRWESQNGMEIKVGSANAGLLVGEVYNKRYFAFAGAKTLSTTAVATAVHFQNKTTYKTQPNKNKAQLVKLKLFIDAPASGTGTVEIKFYKNATITGTPSYTDVDTDNSTIEYATNVTYSSGGKLVFVDYIGYSASLATPGADIGGSDTVTLSDIGLYLLEGETMTITAQNVAGSTNVNVRFAFNWLEEF